MSKEEKEKMKADPKFAMLEELFNDHLEGFFARKKAEEEEAARKKASEGSWFDRMFS